MEVTEIVLLVAGGVIFILSFLLPDKGDKKQGEAEPVAREEVRSLVEQEMDAIKGHVDDVVDEAVTYAMEKTERSLERLSNEKIMAINEYSDTVLAEIHRNHEEAMFLYDMLNSKHANIKDTVSMVDRTVKEAEETVSTFQKLTPETVDPASVIPAPVAVPEHTEQIEKVEGKAPAAPVIPMHSTPKAAFARAALEEMEEMANMDNVKEIFRPESIKMLDTLGEKPADDNSNNRILQLYQQGMDRVAIAKELGVGVGEVKLVIDLYDSENQGK